MLNFKGIENKYKDIDLKVLGYKEVEYECFYYYIIDFEYSINYEDSKIYLEDILKLKITENISNAFNFRLKNNEDKYYK